MLHFLFLWKWRDIVMQHILSVCHPTGLCDQNNKISLSHLPMQFMPFLPLFFFFFYIYLTDVVRVGGWCSNFCAKALFSMDCPSLLPKQSVQINSNDWWRMTCPLLRKQNEKLNHAMESGFVQIGPNEKIRPGFKNSSLTPAKQSYDWQDNFAFFFNTTIVLFCTFLFSTPSLSRQEEIWKKKKF